MADSICVTIGQILTDQQPVFQGCPVTVSALKEDQTTAGYMCGQVIDDKAWMTQIIQDHQITVSSHLHMPITHHPPSPRV